MEQAPTLQLRRLPPEAPARLWRGSVEKTGNYPDMENESSRITPPLTPPQKGGESEGTWSALSLAWELGYTIAVPLVVLVLGGRWLDRYFGTSPWMLLTGVIVSIPISTVVIYMKMAKILEKGSKSDTGDKGAKGESKPL